MAVIIDRRPNGGKSRGNRDRFVKRVKEDASEAVSRQITGQKVGEKPGTNSRVKVKGNPRTFEPHVHHDPESGDKTIVVPGNQNIKGDKIPRPERQRGGGGSGEGAGLGESLDDFEFVLTREEFLDIFFEQLELPDLVKTMLKDATHFRPKRAGFTVAGNPSTLNLGRTMRRSLGRRIGMRRPSKREIQEVMDALAEAESADERDESLIADLRLRLEGLEARTRAVSFIDPMDVRYNRYEQIPLPNTRAVMFCLMDVSGSMDEVKKDLAKRFFILLHLFLDRQYERVDIVFIRHTEVAKEVNEDDFFHSRESGGTVVSTALAEFVRIQRARYPTDEWNIYVAQASDGDNGYNDNKTTLGLMTEEVLPIVQYFAYIETKWRYGEHRKSDLWEAYEMLKDYKHFQMRGVVRQTDIFPVFADLFKKKAN